MGFLTPKIIRSPVGKAVINQKTTRQPIISQRGNGYNASLQPVATNIKAIKNPFARMRH